MNELRQRLSLLAPVADRQVGFRRAIRGAKCDANETEAEISTLN